MSSSAAGNHSCSETSLTLQMKLRRSTATQQTRDPPRRNTATQQTSLTLQMNCYVDPPRRSAATRQTNQGLRPRRVCGALPNRGHTLPSSAGFGAPSDRGDARGGLLEPGPTVPQSFCHLGGFRSPVLPSWPATQQFRAIGVKCISHCSEGATS